MVRAILTAAVIADEFDRVAEALGPRHSTATYTAALLGQNRRRQASGPWPGTDHNQPTCQGVFELRAFSPRPVGSGAKAGLQKRAIVAALRDLAGDGPVRMTRGAGRQWRDGWGGWTREPDNAENPRFTATYAAGGQFDT